jgi:hypothetical protein
MKTQPSRALLQTFAWIVLGMLITPPAFSQEQVLLFDFGGADNQTGLPSIVWNNVDEQLGATYSGFIDLVDSEGAATGFQLWIDEIFDETPNLAGTESAGDYPASASKDSLVNSNGLVILALVGNSATTAETYTITFYASDVAATENLETRYEVAGTNYDSVTLNPSGNVDGTASISGIEPNVLDELVINISPGQNHTGANDIVYLGAMRIDSTAGWSALVDFGSSTAITNVQGSGEVFHWNNVTGGVGNSDTGLLTDIVSTDGASSTLAIEMIARFNGVNTAGTTTSSLYPDTATLDSLFGNTEEFSGMSEVYPSFMVTGLDSSAEYDITFYASRMSTGGDNRETLFTLEGNTTEETTLNPSENVDGTATVEGIQPNASGEITISLAPGSNNNNGYHFTYLGVLRIDLPAEGLTYLFDFGGDAVTEFVIPIQDRWNNIEESIGLTNDGMAEQLVTIEGMKTDIALEMVARFNGVNRNGTLESTVYPASATGDSLFGNTASFNGLENVYPVFKMTGLDPENAYNFKFFGSRTATDNRETRYTVTGTNSAIADLNAASNVDETASADGIIPTAAGEITIEIGPGPNNSNGSEFTYLGVMEMTWVRSFVPKILIDAGGSNFPTNVGDDGSVWNNLLIGTAQSDVGILSDLITVNGTPTPFGIQMIARFNGVNEAGTQEPAPYPTTATQDSLFGNTEDHGGLTNVFPAFMITGLDPAVAYDLTFYGSRNASDNRETEYTVTGMNETVLYLNVAGNIDQVVLAEDMMPTPEGTITVEIGPGPNNNNSAHYTYLGVLQLDWEGGLPGVEDLTITELSYSEGVMTFMLTGQAGRTYTIQGTDDFLTWDDEKAVTLTQESEQVEVEATAPARFYRAVR